MSVFPLLNNPLSHFPETELQLFADSLGLFECLPVSPPTTYPPTSLPVCQSVFAEIWEGPIDWCLSSSAIPPGKPFFDSCRSSRIQRKECRCNCTWLRHEKVIICCQGRQRVSVRQELIRYWLPPECSLTLDFNRLHKVDSHWKTQAAEVGEQGRRDGELKRWKRAW